MYEVWGVEAGSFTESFWGYYSTRSAARAAIRRHKRCGAMRLGWIEEPSEDEEASTIYG
jgi:hypothetical protein